MTGIENNTLTREHEIVSREEWITARKKLLAKKRNPRGCATN